MASWDNYPPPPRRSRSRSPSQKYGQRFPDSTYGSEYRTDWDGGMDRPYAYGRESPVDMRRPRSRSPTADANKKRRRSPSPWADRERYDPRPRYGDTYDFRGFDSHSPPRRGAGYPSRSRAPPDPRTFDYPASLKQYADWFRYTHPKLATDEDNADKMAEKAAGDGSKPRNGIKTLWEKYKKDFASSQLQTMFEHHRKSPWFAEKYDPSPEMQTLRSRVRKEGWKGRLVSFLHDLDSGKFDSDLNELESDKDISELKESNGLDEPKNPGDDDMQFSMEAEEDPVDNDSSRADANGKDSRRGIGNRDRDRGEEVVAPTEGNQVMIRTIPPDIGRVKLEDTCCKIPGYVYLALGDPMQKRNYYRAGWLKFDDSADIGAVMSELSDTKIEGFKLHVSHNTRPFTSRVRYAPEVASKPARLEKDLANAIFLANKFEEQATQLRQMKFKKEDPPTAGGDATASSEPSNASESVLLLAEDEEEEPMEKGTECIERRVEKIMSDLRDQGALDMNDEAAVAAKKTVISLDLYLEYLRAAFHTCYYCAVTTDHVEELQRKCLKHVRKPLSKALIDEIKAAELEKVERETKMDESGDAHDQKDRDAKKDTQSRDRDWRRNDERWLEWLDSKIALLINRDGVDPRDYGGKHYDDELTKVVDPFIKQEDEGKFRCRTCQKLFKATSFVEKHIANKHPELVKALDDIPYFNNFALDPHRIQPFSHPPNQTGNSSQVPPPQAYGVQVQATSFQGDPSRLYSSQVYPSTVLGNAYWNGEYLGGYNHNAGQQGGSRRDRRLSDRISGDFALEVPAAAGLPPKPVSLLDTALSTGTQRRGARGAPGNGHGFPPPPPNAKEDPRAAAGRRVSYHDMDLVAEGDVELSY